MSDTISQNWYQSKDHFIRQKGDQLAKTVELLLSVDRGGPGTLGAQIEDQLRAGVRDGSLRGGAQLPSTRDLAAQLGVSRRIAVEAYAQLAAEGYLVLRQGARPRVAEGATARSEPPTRPGRPAAAGREIDIRPSNPDVSRFPRSAWLRATREVMETATDADLGYSDPRGAIALREALAEYLGRVRGVVADPQRVVVTSGYTQGIHLVLRALAGQGAKRLGMEDPGQRDLTEMVEHAGLEPVPVPVDSEGVRVDALDAARPDAVLVTPAHQHPTGVLMSGARRTALLAWLREHDAVAIEDDYDAEYRFDRAAVGALQGMEPERVIYAGTASKTLSPALRLGWLVVPDHLHAAVEEAKTLADRGNAFLEQMVFAAFLRNGELDRHLRRMRKQYRSSRDALVEVLEAEMPEAEVRGIAAGLHVTVVLPESFDALAVQAEAARRGVIVSTMDRHSAGYEGPPTLLVGFSQHPEPVLRRAVSDLVAAARAA